jgi:hypothetical protein
LVVELDYLPDLEVFVFSRVYTPLILYTPPRGDSSHCRVWGKERVQGTMFPFGGSGAKALKEKFPYKCIL